MIWAVLCLGPQRAIFPATFSSSHRNSNSFLSSLSNPNPTNQRMTRYLAAAAEIERLQRCQHSDTCEHMHLEISCADLPTVHTACTTHRTTRTRSALCSQIHRWRFSSCFGRLAALLALLLATGRFLLRTCLQKEPSRAGGATHPSNNPPKKGDEPGVAIQAA